RFDRVFFCRSFHSKLFPVGGLCLSAGPPGCTDRPALAGLEILDLSARRARRHYGSLPSRLARLREPNEASRFEPNAPSAAKATDCKSGFHPSVQEIKPKL
ncbi:MAG TPA: hypothetical protein VGC26_06455, partial [Afipia sp.]